MLGGTRRGSLLRVGLAIALFAGVLWTLPTRRPGEDGGHHRDHGVVLDAFEKAGITEFTGGQRGPAFRLRTFPGEGHASLDEFKHNLLILNFWATWCTPCTIEMPTLEMLWQEYRARGLMVLGVSVDRGAPRALLEPYITHQRLTFPILLDPDLKTAGAWRVTSLPATFIVRPGGEVVGRAAGAREWNSAEMRALLETLLPVAQVSAVSRTGLRPALALTGPGPSSTLGPVVTHADSRRHR
ncbi:MAG: TlpA disulfide reductase family protein [Candidatus Rokubacteria bacterium]|nr:TlpA disulfide reductase family protein [Candidatus Rokubacteria bacterium]